MSYFLAYPLIYTNLISMIFGCYLPNSVKFS